MIQPIVCPICHKAAGQTADGGKSISPFCSVRCRQIDFFRWFDGRYQIVEDLNLESLDGIGEMGFSDDGMQDDAMQIDSRLE